MRIIALISGIAGEVSDAARVALRRAVGRRLVRASLDELHSLRREPDFHEEWMDIVAIMAGRFGLRDVAETMEYITGENFLTAEDSAVMVDIASRAEAFYGSRRAAN